MGDSGTRYINALKYVTRKIFSQIYFLNFEFIMNRIHLEQESIKRRGIDMDWNRWHIENKGMGVIVVYSFFRLE